VRPDFYALLVEHAGDARGQIDVIRFGKWLRAIKGQVHRVDGHNYKIIPFAVSSGHGNSWKLELEKDVEATPDAGG
jgi:hypothetical protein